jgi:hypothetical protein
LICPEEFRPGAEKSPDKAAGVNPAREQGEPELVFMPQPAPHGRPEENLRFGGKPAFSICPACEAQAFKPDIRVLKPRHPTG